MAYRVRTAHCLTSYKLAPVLPSECLESLGGGGGVSTIVRAVGRGLSSRKAETKGPWASSWPPNLDFLLQLTENYPCSAIEVFIEARLFII
jgi:hypothetical protein